MWITRSSFINPKRTFFQSWKMQVATFKSHIIFIQKPFRETPRTCTKKNSFALIRNIDLSAMCVSSYVSSPSFLISDQSIQLGAPTAHKCSLTKAFRANAHVSPITHCGYDIKTRTKAFQTYPVISEVGELGHPVSAKNTRSSTISIVSVPTLLLQFICQIFEEDSKRLAGYLMPSKR